MTETLRERLAADIDPFASNSSEVGNPITEQDQWLGETHGAGNLRDTVRRRLADLMQAKISVYVIRGKPNFVRSDFEDAADAILREFRLQPVAVGRVDAETGEVD